MFTIFHFHPDMGSIHDEDYIVHYRNHRNNQILKTLHINIYFTVHLLYFRISKSNWDQSNRRAHFGYCDLYETYILYCAAQVTGIIWTWHHYCPHSTLSLSLFSWHQPWNLSKRTVQSHCNSLLCHNTQLVLHFSMLFVKKLWLCHEGNMSTTTIFLWEEWPRRAHSVVLLLLFEPGLNLNIFCAPKHGPVQTSAVVLTFSRFNTLWLYLWGSLR